MTDSEKDRLMWGGCSLQEARDILDREEAVLDHIQSENARLLAENAKLREALEMVDAQVSCADVRMDKGPRYRFMTSGQHDVIMAVKATLGTVDANQGVEPSSTADDRATGHGSAAESFDQELTSEES